MQRTPFGELDQEKTIEMESCIKAKAQKLRTKIASNEFRERVMRKVTPIPKLSLPTTGVAAVAAGGKKPNTLSSVGVKPPKN